MSGHAKGVKMADIDKIGQESLGLGPVFNEISASIWNIILAKMAVFWTLLDAKLLVRLQTAKHGVAKLPCPIFVMAAPNDDKSPHPLTSLSAGRYSDFKRP